MDAHEDKDVSDKVMTDLREASIEALGTAWPQSVHLSSQRTYIPYLYFIYHLSIAVIVFHWLRYYLIRSPHLWGLWRVSGATGEGRLERTARHLDVTSKDRTAVRKSAHTSGSLHSPPGSEKPPAATGQQLNILLCTRIFLLGKILFQILVNVHNHNKLKLWPQRR